MHATCKVIAIGAVLALMAADTTAAEASAGDRSRGPDHMQPAVPSEQRPTAPGSTQQMIVSGQRLISPGQMQEMTRQHQGMMGDHRGMDAAVSTPTLPGQDAFGAIQEIVGILDADPKTDWSKVNLEALRQHLIDMNEVTLHAGVTPNQIDGGLEVAITGSGRTLIAIQRMIPEWARMANGLNGWTMKVAQLSNGELMTVTATAPKEVQHIRGLGFIGLLASGSWHQAHHLMMARGELDHEHMTHQH